MKKHTKTASFAIALILHVWLLTALTITLGHTLIKEPMQSLPVLVIGPQDIVAPAISKSGDVEEQQPLPPALDAPPIEYPPTDAPPTEELPEEDPADVGEPPPQIQPPGTPPEGMAEGEVDAPEEEPTTLYGVPVHGKVLLLLDTSGSMEELDLKGRRRIDSLALMVLGAIAGFRDTDEFDCVTFGNGSAVPMWGELRLATEANKSEAARWVANKLAWPGGDTPTLKALHVACNHYPLDLDLMFMITDGVPSETPTVVLGAAKDLWVFDNCSFIGVCVGEVGVEFMKKLADLLGGVCVTTE